MFLNLNLFFEDASSFIQNSSSKIIPQSRAGRFFLCLSAIIYSSASQSAYIRKKFSSKGILAANTCLTLISSIVFRSLEQQTTAQKNPLLKKDSPPNKSSYSKSWSKQSPYHPLKKQSISKSEKIFPIANEVVEKKALPYSIDLFHIQGCIGTARLLHFKKDERIMNAKEFFESLIHHDECCIALHEQVKAISQKYEKGFILRSPPIYLNKEMPFYLTTSSIIPERPIDRIDNAHFEQNSIDQAGLTYKYTDDSGMTYILTTDTPSPCFKDLNEFCANATPDQAIEFWKSVAKEVLAQAEGAPVWISTPIYKQAKSFYVRIQANPVISRNLYNPLNDEEGARDLHEQVLAAPSTPFEEVLGVKVVKVKISPTKNLDK